MIVLGFIKIPFDVESVNSKTQILKSTTIVGGAQVFTVLLQIVRTKIIALLLGPTGVGILGNYNSIVDLSRNCTGLGINFSGVRDIAQAASTNDTRRLGTMATVLRKLAFLTGIIGSIIVAVFSKYISEFTFGNDKYSTSILVLSLAVFITSISQSQIAYLQGYRKLLDMSKASVLGVALSIIIIIPIYSFWGLKGMVPAIILMACSSLFLSHHYVKKNSIEHVDVKYKDVFRLGKDMVKVGIVASMSGLIGSLAMYFMRSFITVHGGTDSVGFFQASWSVSNVYLLTVLNSMGADYFPRLSAVNTDNKKINSLVNDQLEIALIVGAPLVIGMISFAPLVMHVLYSSKFVSSNYLLIYLVAGSFLKLISWPLCFVFAAKGSMWRIIAPDALWNLCFILLSVLLWNKWNLLGVGISYVISYVVYVLFAKLLISTLSGFKFSKRNIKIIIVYVILLIPSVVVSLMFKSNVKYIGSIFFLVSIFCSYYGLKKVVDLKSVIDHVKSKFCTKKY